MKAIAVVTTATLALANIALVWGWQPVFAQLIAASPLSAAQERALKPKDAFKECANCPEMVVVPAGSFNMGYDRVYDPAGHAVTFAQQFAVGRFAVTFDEWDACVADGGCEGYRPKDNGWGRGRQPVIFVSWDNAQTYVGWLSKKTGKTYRLLSSAEREYVTRAGTSTRFWWGDSISPKQANYDPYAYDPDHESSAEGGQYRARPLIVDSFAPNPWGLYQVHGNVWEWTEDRKHADYVGAPIDGSAWTRGLWPQRVVRGGAWSSQPNELHSGWRDAYETFDLGDSLGLRIARTLLSP